MKNNSKMQRLESLQRLFEHNIRIGAAIEAERIVAMMEKIKDERTEDNFRNIARGKRRYM